MTDLRSIIESLLFVSKEPLTIDRLKTVLEVEEAAPIREALESLAAEYDARGGGFFLREVAGGYQIRTRPEHAEWIRKLLQPGSGRLSKAAMETLAIIAYKQPVIRADVEHIRGVDCGGVIRSLMERKLIRVLGRKEIPGRPLIYATTRQFLEAFDLKDIRDLPRPKEIAAPGSEAAEPAPEKAAAEAAGEAIAQAPSTGEPARAEGLPDPPENPEGTAGSTGESDGKNA